MENLAVIDPSNVTDFKRTSSQLETFWLFCLFVAGKTAYVQARKLHELRQYYDMATPFASIRRAGPRYLERALREVKIGQYLRLTRAVWASLDLDLRRVSVDDLEDIRGVGPKTARFFLLHTRPAQNVAVLDTHILAHLRDHGYPAPRTTPQSVATYRRTEELVLDLAHRAGMTPADFDLHVWRQRARMVAA
jgi:thermostable 8-oxoguanine DNA glycosylase